MLGLDFGLKENIGKKRKGDGQKVNGPLQLLFWKGRKGNQRKQSDYLSLLKPLFPFKNERKRKERTF